MNKILLIVPPSIDFEKFAHPPYNVRTLPKEDGNYGSALTDMPLGVLSLSAYVKKYSAAETRLIDFNIVLNKLGRFEFRSFAEFFLEFLSAKEWIDYAPDIVGISTLFTTSYQNMLDIAQCCRETFPNAVIVAGGGVPTNMYKEIFRDSVSFDALCYGEGEKFLLGLVLAEDKKEFLKGASSSITEDKVANKKSFQHEFIEDLDEIPLYDYSMLNIDDYRLNPTIAAYPLVDSTKQHITMMTSRGCPYLCCFCSAHSVHGRKVRYYSVSRVREDIKYVKDHYGTETVIFQDDHFMANRQRAFEIINILKEFQMTAFFPNSLALYALDRKMLEALKSIGVKMLVMAIESGSNRVLKEVMHKPLDLSIVKRVMSDCRQLGIATDVNIIIGLPGETKQDIEDARVFLKTLDASWFRIYTATPLVGSEMFDLCIKKKYLRGGYINGDFKKAVIETEDFTAEYIQEKAYSLNLELNFVVNSDFKLGDYESALKEFENTIKVKPDHAFAYYFAARCCKMMHLDEKYLAYKAKYKEIMEESAFWRDYANQFGLVALE
jgi:anaerobic magnesium-protoporphyrin IX monomethyl ester cyclase